MLLLFIRMQRFCTAAKEWTSPTTCGRFCSKAASSRLGSCGIPLWKSFRSYRGCCGSSGWISFSLLGNLVQAGCFGPNGEAPADVWARYHGSSECFELLGLQGALHVTRSSQATFAMWWSVSPCVVTASRCRSSSRFGGVAARTPSVEGTMPEAAEGWVDRRSLPLVLDALLHHVPHLWRRRICEGCRCGVVFRLLRLKGCPGVCREMSVVNIKHGRVLVPLQGGGCILHQLGLCPLAVSLSWWAVQVGRAVLDVPRMPSIETVGGREHWLELHHKPCGAGRWHPWPSCWVWSHTPTGESKDPTLRGRVSDYLREGQ